mmetsp:Transcript_11203/g.33159  ORF Transcript_11203/g.33159 Transcript_11203/m.33159 type:complete len:111 (-) Transcript_11203:1248-1580(-)|eukprot:CAMPEP_0113528712 /NCGR_PEP_ID=MMETSP0015_2-20120614/1993_1 /TAXON_ID=2838 /ORGANISM="Odontella" /LENGTH=110 /DNA_ID=CAMNT_0000427267 /DNA_START=224 /DNA_END=556 /DNA_ORIENTATION=- /assembly_acc=CAM_ASM_000160
MCTERGLPTDVSTAVLIDDDGTGYTESDSVLRLFRFMGFPWTILGFLALLIPAIIRDTGYKLFARNRGKIWKAIKKATGMGDTRLEGYQHKIMGLEGPLDPGWGFDIKED